MKNTLLTIFTITLALLLIPYTHAALENNLLLYTNLESSTNTSDLVNNHTLYVNGAPTTTVGKCGFALAFDGATDYVRYSNVNSTQPRSYSFWVKADANDTTRAIFYQYDSPNALTNSFYQIDSPPRMGGYVTGGIYILTPFDTNTWYHFVHTNDGATRRLYKDGVLVNNDSNAVDPNVYGDVYLANDQFSQYYDGIIDEFAMWNQNLSDEEVTALYNGGQGIYYDGTSFQNCTPGAFSNPLVDNLVGYYAMDENETYTDTSTSNNNATGTIAGTVPGKIGQGININDGKYGAGQYFQSPSIAATQFSDNSNFTACVWVNSTKYGDPVDYFSNQYNTNSPNDFIYALAYRGATSKVYASASNAYVGSSFAYSDSGTTSGVWHHWCYVYKGDTKEFKIYVDSINTGTGTFTYTPTNAPTYGHFLSTRDTNDGDFHYDEFGLWNTSLDPTDIQTLYNSNCGYNPITEQNGTCESIPSFTNETVFNVTLVGPANDSNVTAPYVDLYYTVNTWGYPTGWWGIKYFRNGVVVNTGGISSPFTIYAPAGDYTWQIELDGVINSTEWIFHSLCTPVWVCNGYASCNMSDERPCNSVTDTNTCGTPYGGDYSEFTPLSCNYCTSTYAGPTLGPCIADNQTVTYVYTNTCCADTGLPSDCNIPANTTQTCSNAYQPDYSADDVGTSVIDVITTVILVIGSFSAVVALILGWRWFKGKKLW